MCNLVWRNRNHLNALRPTILIFLNTESTFLFVLPIVNVPIFCCPKASINMVFLADCILNNLTIYFGINSF